ncbi:hypothetical protein H6503_03465 [Candidatus Woesearchaeota archaeon]|nr:hypothetical protein [Candidatus Woesearchaeota archaeon]
MKTILESQQHWQRTGGLPYPDGQRLFRAIVPHITSSKPMPTLSGDNEIFNTLSKPISIDEAIKQYDEHGKECADPMLVNVFSDLDSYNDSFFDTRDDKENALRAIKEITITDYRNVLFLSEYLVLNAPSESNIFVYSRESKDKIIYFLTKQLIAASKRDVRPVISTPHDIRINYLQMAIPDMRYRRLESKSLGDFHIANDDYALKCNLTEDANLFGDGADCKAELSLHPAFRPQYMASDKFVNKFFN